VKKDEEQEDLCSELALLNEEMKQHEWTAFGQNEAESLKKVKKEMGREACGPDKAKGE